MTTIKDIARVAGVSVTTVSRALNGYHDVNEQTRQKIVRVAKDLNYSPNTLARGLVLNKSKTIGLLVSGLNRQSAKDHFTFEVLSGINECVSEQDYDLVLFNTNTSKQREKTYSQLCRERRVDGVILSGIKTDDPYLHEVVASSIPCILIDIPIQSDSVGYVTTDNVLGAKQAVEHLMQLGHRNIAMVNGHGQAFVSQHRLDGFKQGLAAGGRPYNPDWVVNGFFDEDIARVEAERLLTRYPEITAVFCASDLMALGVLKAANNLGIVVPKRLSVVGYDDILLASYASPPLTTIAQDKFQLGYEAAKLLIRMLEGQDNSRAVLLETELITRQSTTGNHV
ncbi:LacI family DNA-binding transcriptional regulator [Paenibacillus xerothermodurans]|uniref:LacI family transcriptional regulator n=1 Tax=Paenibacillus xerothermodurans TaxID=1977292 RepID=A0A2W1NDE5_PAEXE|nr:LacI family DNA-binding transcriptional regulator [Paenibacillus xerothermodurans]PZE21121.1 LacI family transcriptional regulator [Paenibacillus xerothermodurans]